MKIEEFSFSPHDYAAELTSQSQQTLYWLNRNGYLNNEDTVELLQRMVVVPIKNNKRFGRYLLDRLFGKDQDPSVYVFPITLLEEVDEPTESNDKPTLTVVK